MRGSTAETGKLRDALRPSSWAGRANGVPAAARRGARGLGLRAEDADLVVLAALLALTAALGRAFSRLGVGETLFITEVLLVAVIALLLVRLGVPTAWHQLRARVPLALLGAFWLLGAIAAVRGLQAFDLSLVTEDIGIAEYSVLLPLVALVVSDRRRLELLAKALLIGSVAALVVFLAHSIALRAGGGGAPFSMPAGAFGMYISFFVIWIAARAVNGIRVPRWELALAAVGLFGMWLTDQRSVWLVALLAGVGVVALAPRKRILAAAAGLGATAAVTFALYLALSDAFPIPQGTTSGGVAEQQPTQPVEEIGGIAGGESEEGANVEWRLSYWKELARRSASNPSTAAIGVGFGEPLAFTWAGKKYDFRDGDPAAQMDVGGPHNSFVAIMHRMGVPALLAVLGILAVAAWRALPLLREDRLPASRRAELVAILGVLLSTIAIAGFNEALKGPFLGMFFWVALALLLVYPVIERNSGSSTSSREGSERTASVAAS